MVVGSRKLTAEEIKKFPAGKLGKPGWQSAAEGGNLILLNLYASELKKS
jgi:hypothetical protein